MNAALWIALGFLSGSLPFSVWIGHLAVLAEYSHPLNEHLVSPHNPKGLFILSGGFSNGCAFSARTPES
jgi:hypothetical protein